MLPHRAQNWLLLVASYYFYAAWDWRFLGLLIASTLVDYSCARALGRTDSPATRRALLVLSLGFNLTLLGFFKYFNFFADNLHAVFGALGWRLDFVTLRVLLPVGISFYTFVTMSYVIDVYRREIQPTRNLLDFAVFVAFFPHLVAGPILRASRLLPQIDAAAHASRASRCATALWLIAWGFFQKIFVADNLAGIANTRLRPGRRTDRRQRAARHLRVRVPDLRRLRRLLEHRARHVEADGHRADRELPLPLPRPQRRRSSGGTGTSACRPGCATTCTSRSAAAADRPWQTRRNLLITMVLGGLWHGAAWTFVLWGVYHGVLLIAYRACRTR